MSDKPLVTNAELEPEPYWAFSADLGTELYHKPQPMSPYEVRDRYERTWRPLIKKLVEATNAQQVQLLSLAEDYRREMASHGGSEDIHPLHKEALRRADDVLKDAIDKGFRI